MPLHPPAEAKKKKSPKGLGLVAWWLLTLWCDLSLPEHPAHQFPSSYWLRYPRSAPPATVAGETGAPYIQETTAFYPDPSCWLPDRSIQCSNITVANNRLDQSRLVSFIFANTDQSGKKEASL
ncbi:hypothetical protein EDB81DRAFT_186192 [Dactylonectria macrodidyma]|uniref:Uncharacterized protein n=1 Tax=Dactylonectria macrodidyma TaxID=307937 RepID=A0A9P9FR02_9HYPO|nr:hypothetical protein EDB81DRAFT_186192 [Dactylonectria macrodidyma]